MKRLITFTIAGLMLFSVTGCKTLGGGEEITAENNLDTAFQTETNITLDEMKASGVLCRFGEGMWEIEFDSPNTLSGVKLEFSEGTSTASYKGLSFSVPQSALPVKSMMNNLISVTDELARNEELSGEKENGEMKISGSLESGDYTLTMDKSGNLKRFEMPNMKLVMEFGEMKEIGSGSSDSQPEENTEAVNISETEIITETTESLTTS